MKKIIIAVLLSTAFSSYAERWYEVKGTLNQATVVEWHKADYSNKLATAGDMVAAGFQNNIFVDKIKFTNIDQVKIFADGLVKCIDTGTLDKSGKVIISAAKEQKVVDLTVVCMQLMGWLKKG